MNEVQIVIIHHFRKQMELAPLIENLLRLEMSILIPLLNKLRYKLKNWIWLIFQIILCLKIGFILLRF